MVHLPISILLLLAITILQCSAHQEEVTTFQTRDNLSSKKRNLSSNTPSPTWLDYPSQEDSSLELYDDDEEGDEKLASLEDEMEVLNDLGEIMDEEEIGVIDSTIDEEGIKGFDELESLSDTLIVPLMDEEDTNGNTNTDTTTKREKHKERRKKSTLGGPPQKKTGGHKQKHNELQKARHKHHKEARTNRIKKNQATHGKHNNEAQADQNIEPLVSHTIDMTNTQMASTKAAKEYPSEDTSLIKEQQIAEEETMKRLIMKKKKIMEEEEGLGSITDGKARKLQHKRGRR